MTGRATSPHPVIAYREALPPVFALRCDLEQCAVRAAPPAGMDELTAWKRGLCAPRGCYLGASSSPEGRAAIAAAHGYRVVRTEGEA